MSERIDILEVANATLWITCLEPAVEVAIAVARVAAVIVEGAVDDQFRVGCDDARQALEQLLHRFPAHDVQGVRGEHEVVACIGPCAAYVERDRRQHVAQAGLVDPRANAGVVFRQLRSLPAQMRQGGAEMNGVLACSTADLERFATIGAVIAQHVEDRIAIAVAGWSVGLVHGAL